MTETASLVADGLHDVADTIRGGRIAVEQLARAICCLAVKQESRNPGEQRELAAILWNDVVTDFREVPVTEEMRTWFASIMKIDPKTFPKRPYGR